MPKTGSAPASTALVVFRLTALFTFLAVAMGALVCATWSVGLLPHLARLPSGPDRPAVPAEPAHRVHPPGGRDARRHRVLAAAVMSTRRRGPDRSVRILPWVALIGALAAGAFGRFAVVSGLPTWLGEVDLFSP